MKKLTVAEYAKLYNISVQAVYKKIEKLETVEEERNGRTITFIVINEAEETTAGEGIQPAEVEIQPENQPHSTDFQPDFQPNSTEFQPENEPKKVENQPDIQPEIQPDFNHLNATDATALLISTLQEQIKEKDKQIERLQKAAEEKDKQIKEQFERLTQLINQEQQLGAATHKVLLGQGEPEEEENVPPQVEEQNNKPASKEEVEEKPKKGFWRRLFGL